MPRYLVPLDDVIGTHSKVRVLRLMMGTDSLMSGREVARQVQMAHRGVKLALEELTALGLLLREQTAREDLYRLNRSHHLVATGLHQLFVAERQWSGDLLDALRDLLASTGLTDSSAGVYWAAIFGSTARGEDRPDSDLDFIVVTRSRTQAAAVHDALSADAPAFRDRFGIQLSPVVMDLARLRTMNRDKAPFVEAIRKDARQVFGTVTLEEMLGDTAPAATSGSPLDVPGVNANLRRRKLGAMIRESHASSARYLKRTGRRS